MADDSLEKRQRATITEVSRLLTEAGVDHWLYGGWAVDYHLGRVTRRHSDVDFVARLEDRSTLSDLLRNVGFEPRLSEVPDAVQSFVRDDIDVEVTFITTGRDGTTVTTGFEAWPWDVGTFGTDRGRLDGQVVPLVSTSGLIAVKSGWREQLGGEPRTHDLADLELLDELATTTEHRGVKSARNRGR